jgi:hypothetical protein
MTTYERRCRELLDRNAHNMTADEIERAAYGAGDMLLAQLAAAAIPEDDDAIGDDDE